MAALGAHLDISGSPGHPQGGDVTNQVTLVGGRPTWIRMCMPFLAIEKFYCLLFRMQSKYAQVCAHTHTPLRRDSHCPPTHQGKVRGLPVGGRTGPSPGRSNDPHGTEAI